mmetsp:Transcript_119712/g.338898  ORF Transcript_119712/g.338898 Transcript_119712/m.338898 type:complete len:228 (+) Transcript_119712:748-1431(+)
MELDPEAVLLNQTVYDLVGGPSVLQRLFRGWLGIDHPTNNGRAFVFASDEPAACFDTKLPQRVIGLVLDDMTCSVDRVAELERKLFHTWNVEHILVAFEDKAEIRTSAGAVEMLGEELVVVVGRHARNGVVAHVEHAHHESRRSTANHRGDGETHKDTSPVAHHPTREIAKEAEGLLRMNGFDDVLLVAAFQEPLASPLPAGYRQHEGEGHCGQAQVYEQPWNESVT